ncbi:hypothetical protein G3N55_02880 [Dissulfurirhabdus thermomarina]|uniref:Uncharacterized protein n=1 Tax=Dissulfurirhabdus thermomarina TaxID=1765737 RepID=A0A6N9TL60_DISTH|nr:hypothetical protein [Dissulfurirhabdus thermomarina]NDY41798.1 hypothetical protein [Dissulfurirhabdus thermomarina]NMX24061.1 hypothetical protein [Dissulfurirhabdus thermomarina]
MDPKRRRLLDVAFLAAVAAVVGVLVAAPSARGPRLPADADHRVFPARPRAEAEAACPACHSERGPAPLAAGHPPKPQCLHCHEAARPKR